MGAQIASALALRAPTRRLASRHQARQHSAGSTWQRVAGRFRFSQATDEANLTTAGDLVGTLRYMAPENFRVVMKNVAISSVWD